MLGALWGLIVGGAVVKEKVGDYLEDEGKRLESLGQGEETYYKYSDGTERLHSNGHRAIRTNLPNDDYVLKDIDKQTIVRNYTKERLDEFLKQQKQWAEEEGRSTYCCWYDRFVRNPDRKKYCPDGIIGSRFKDFKTGRIYVMREFSADENPYDRDLYYYIDVNEKKVVRPIDAQSEWLGEPFTLEYFLKIDERKFREYFNHLSEEEFKTYMERSKKINQKRYNMDALVEKKLYVNDTYEEFYDFHEMVHKEGEVRVKFG